MLTCIYTNLVFHVCMYVRFDAFKQIKLILLLKLNSAEIIISDQLDSLHVTSYVLCTCTIVLTVNVN